jgi:hypothetical protein
VISIAWRRSASGTRFDDVPGQLQKFEDHTDEDVRAAAPSPRIALV